MVTKVVLAFDGDAAGREAARKFTKHYGSLFSCQLISMPEGKDWGDLSLAETRELVKTAAPWKGK